MNLYIERISHVQQSLIAFNILVNHLTRQKIIQKKKSIEHKFQKCMQKFNQNRIFIICQSYNMN